MDREKSSNNESGDSGRGGSSGGPGGGGGEDDGSDDDELLMDALEDVFGDSTIETKAASTKASKVKQGGSKTARKIVPRVVASKTAPLSPKTDQELDAVLVRWGCWGWGWR